MEERQKRYTITMSIRTACFLLFLVVPGWWKVVTLALAALLPAIAVVLANGENHRAPVLGEDEERPAADKLALSVGAVIPGEIDDD